MYIGFIFRLVKLNSLRQLSYVGLKQTPDVMKLVIVFRCFLYLSTHLTILPFAKSVEKWTISRHFDNLDKITRHEIVHVDILITRTNGLIYLLGVYEFKNMR